MYRRSIIALILITSVSISIPARTRPQEESDQEQQDLSVQPIDKQDALEIARIFNEQMEKESDISPLVDKYFVSDFYERFAKEAANTAWFPAKPKALAQADTKDVRRYYIASTNFVFLFCRLAFTLEKQQKDKLLAEEGRVVDDVDDIITHFPKDVVEAFRSNRHLSNLIPDGPDDRPDPSTENEAQSEEKATTESNTESEESENEIKTIEQLQALSLSMEIAAARIRGYLNTLPADKTALDCVIPQDDDVIPQDADADTPRSSFGVSQNAYITDEESFYGVNKGTRLVCAAAFSLHIDMIRIDGELKVLAAYMPVRD